jgi:IstB-like ATP binding protein/Transposase IS116/IS110/IS902 family
MERSDVLEMLDQLKLFGMHAAFDEAMTAGLKRKHSVQQIIGELLRAEIAEKQARSMKYQLTIAKLPLAKELADFRFADTPVNEALVRDLAAGAFLAQQRLPELARQILQVIVDQLHDTMARVREIELRLTRWHRQSQLSRLLATVPGVGIMGASAIAATVVDPSLFRSAREFAAWLDDTAAEFEWRQGTSGTHQQARRQIYPQPADRRRGRCSASCAQSTDTGRRVGSRHDGAQADQGRRRSVGQQDRSYRVGGDDAGDGYRAKQVLG